MTASTGWLIERHALRAEVLSPLHIGSGGTPLQRDRDYLLEGNTAQVLDVEALIDALGPQSLGISLERIGVLLTRRPHMRAQVMARRLRLSAQQDPNEIRTFVRTGLGDAYLPGSTLKGAIRNALAWQVYQPPLDAGALGYRAELAARPLEQRLFGPNPNEDALRALRCADCPVEAGDDFIVAAASIYLRVRDRSDLPALQARATRENTIHVEAAPTGAVFSGSVEVDRGLLEGRAAGGRPLRLGSAAAATPDWIGACRAFGLALIEHEQRFFAEAAPRGTARHFYDELAQEGRRLGPKEALIQVGWGTSWRAKTIGLQLTEQEINALKQKYGGSLSRWHGAEFPRLFPKSRKLCDDRDGQPGRPLGWVRLTIVD